MNSPLRFYSGTFWAYVQNWLARGFGIVALLVLGRLLRPEDFGAFALILAMLSLAELFVEQGLAHALVQREFLDELHLNTAFWVSVAAGLIFAVLAIGLAAPLSEAFGYTEVKYAFWGVAPVFLLMSLACVPSAMLRRELQYRILARRSAIANGCSTIVAIILAWSGFGVWTFVGQQCTYHLVGVIVLWRNSRWRPSLVISLSHLKQLGGFSSQVLMIKILDFVESRVVDLIVGKALGLGALGNYSLAMRSHQALTQLVSAPIWETALSAFARGQVDRQALKIAYARFTELSLILAVPIFLIVGSAAPHLIPAIFGDQWRNSIYAFQILCILGAARSFSVLNNCLLEALGMAGFSLLLMSIRTATTLIAVATFLHLGIEGVSFALLCGQMVMMPLSYILVNRFAGVPLGDVGACCLKITVTAIVASLLTMVVTMQVALYTSNIVAAMVGCSVGMLVFSGFMIVVLPTTLLAHLEAVQIENVLPKLSITWLQKLVATRR